MSTISLRCLVVLLGLCAFACKREYSNYCPGALNDNCKNVDAAIPRCSGDQQCAAPTAVCDLSGTMVCVQCTPAEATACTGATPACIGTTCQKCTAHTQCPTSNVCLPDGTCADAAQVAYVQATGTGSPPCAKASPCGTLDDGVKANKPTVKIAAGTVADSKLTTIDGKAVTIVADPGAKLDRSNDGPILEVRSNGADVKIYDLEVTGGTGVVTDAAITLGGGGAPKLGLTRTTIDGNQGIGISATGGALTIAQSTISGNTGGGLSATGGTLTIAQSTISLNTAGGLSISGAQFDITNTFIVSNGGASTPFGGVSIAQTGSGTRRFEFNTVSNNVGVDGAALGMVCSLVTQPIVLTNNIIYGNQTGGTRTQVGGAMCSWTYSDIGPDTVAGTMNTSADPMFVNPTQGNFHIKATSPARDAADPAATLAVDFDGDTRPQGAHSDMGADEWKP
jgi:Right handed beta helix region